LWGHCWSPVEVILRNFWCHFWGYFYVCGGWCYFWGHLEFILDYFEGSFVAILEVPFEVDFGITFQDVLRSFLRSFLLQASSFWHFWCEFWGQFWCYLVPSCYFWGLFFILQCKLAREKDQTSDIKNDFKNDIKMTS